MKSLYLSGGGAFGAWQAGVLHKLLLNREYGHLIGGSAGALNGACICLAFYEYAIVHGNKASMKGAQKYASAKVKELWEKALFIPKMAEHILRILFCFNPPSTMFPWEVNKEVCRFFNLFEKDTVENGFKNFGEEVNGIPVPKLSIVTTYEHDKYVTSTESKEYLFMFHGQNIHTYSLSSDNMMMGDWNFVSTTWNDSVDRFRNIILASASIPKIFPPVKVWTSDGSVYFLSDGAMINYIPFIFRRDLENFPKNFDVVVCSQSFLTHIEDTCISNFNFNGDLERLLSQRFEGRYNTYLSNLKMRIEQINPSMSDKIDDHMIFIPFASPDNPAECTLSWSSVDYSIRNKKSLFKMGVATYNALTNSGRRVGWKNIII
jgi:predicted acylesterase/phospholipase RssA